MVLLAKHQGLVVNKDSIVLVKCPCPGSHLPEKIERIDMRTQPDIFEKLLRETSICGGHEGTMFISDFHSVRPTKEDGEGFE